MAGQRRQSVTSPMERELPAGDNPLRRRTGSGYNDREQGTRRPTRRFRALFNFDILLQQILNGLVLGSVYALVALGYTMVYGILQLINFAHGEVLMIGAMVGVTVVTYGFAGSTLPGWLQLLIALAAAVPVCVIVSLLMERLAY